jgi:hypothetical protein
MWTRRRVEEIFVAKTVSDYTDEKFKDLLEDYVRKDELEGLIEESVAAAVENITIDGGEV